jgi:sugar phosphate isomerase/epimerase
VHTFITESGHPEPEPPVPGVEYRFQEDVWQRMVATGKELAQRAERHDARVLMEPYFGSFFASAKRTRLFIEEVNSPRIRVLLDPANLLEINDLDEMFAQLAPWIDCLHAKDRKLHAIGGVAAGEGDIDYDQFVALATRHAPQAPFILEYVGTTDYQAALKVLLDALERNTRPHNIRT